MVMRSRLQSLISLLIHTVIFCFPPPTLTTPSNPSLTPNFCAFAARTKILRPNLWKWEPFLSNVAIPCTHLLDSAIQKAFNNSHHDTLKPPLAKIFDDKIPLVLSLFTYQPVPSAGWHMQLVTGNLPCKYEHGYECNWKDYFKNSAHWPPKLEKGRNSKRFI